jgi:hypothetical protein
MEMPSMTINEALALQKALQGRLSDLRRMVVENLVETVETYRGDVEKIVEKKPKYDPKVIDTKIVELETALFKLDSSVKQANATAKVETTVNVDELLKPIS